MITGDDWCMHHEPRKLREVIKTLEDTLKTTDLVIRDDFTLIGTHKSCNDTHLSAIFKSDAGQFIQSAIAVNDLDGARKYGILLNMTDPQFPECYIRVR